MCKGLLSLCLSDQALQGAVPENGPVLRIREELMDGVNVVIFSQDQALPKIARDITSRNINTEIVGISRHLLVVF